MGFRMALYSVHFDLNEIGALTSLLVQSRTDTRQVKQGLIAIDSIASKGLILSAHLADKYIGRVSMLWPDAHPSLAEVMQQCIKTRLKTRYDFSLKQ